MTETAENTSDPETESLTEEEVEPKLKYIRLTNDLQNILSKDAVSCIAVHSKFLCLGTHWGGVYLLDHQGNKVSLYSKTKFQTHVVSVNQISVDLKGEFIATCSDDRVVFVHGIYTEDNQQKLTMNQNVKSVALDPYYYKPGSGRRFVVGDTNLTLYEKTFLKGLKSTVLGTTDGYVTGIAWSEQWIAWASNTIGVRVYDLNEKSSLGLIRWEEPKGSSLNDFRCNLRWSTPETLLIGWCDTIRICVIRKRNAVEVSTKNLPEYIVDPISTFQTDFYICGLAPLDTNQLVVLGYPKERDSDNKAYRPILSVLHYNTTDYTEICTDSLSIRGYQEYVCNDYHLDCLIDENQYFIVSPKDIVVASRYDKDDRVEWLIQHEKYVQAMEVISTEGGKYTLTHVSRLYLDHLLSLNQYEEAAKICLTAFGNDKILWEEEVYKFVKVQQLRAVSAYLPRTIECKLNPQIYEMVLYEYLHFDKKGFLTLIKEWSPELYKTQAVINAIHDHMNETDKNILLEALAILYSHEKNYKRALEYYLDLKHKDVFHLIKSHDLGNSIYTMLIRLFDLDIEKSISLLLDSKKISSDVVVKHLQSKPEYLYLYLDALDHSKNSNATKYHEELVYLYAKFAKEKLLPFLKKSHSYKLQKALDICRQNLFYPEMVYLLGRMGNTKEALTIIIDKIKDIQYAIEFCKENDDMELWNDLIDQSLNKPEIMTKLLDGIVGYVNPEILINKINIGQEIPGLKGSIIKMLSDFSLQVSIQNGCNQILATDYFNLVEKVVQNQKRAHTINIDTLCKLCQRELIVKEPLKSDIVTFNCLHFFHEKCLPENFEPDFCIVCHSTNQNFQTKDL